MSLRIEDEQLFYDCCYMEKSQFHIVYSSYFNWSKEKSDSVYKLVREYIIDNLVPINKQLQKSKKRKESDRQEIKSTSTYKFIKF